MKPGQRLREIAFFVALRRLEESLLEMCTLLGRQFAADVGIDELFFDCLQLLVKSGVGKVPVLELIAFFRRQLAQKVADRSVIGLSFGPHSSS
jgi:hypothetical protein